MHVFRIGVVGTTGWGTTLAVLLTRIGHDVCLLARTRPEARRLDEQQVNTRLAPGAPFPRGLRVTADPEEALSHADLVLVAVPSTAMRENMRQIAAHIDPGVLVVSATKGIEIETGRRMSELITEEAPAMAPASIGALSGPNLAREIAAGKPSSATLAFTGLEVAERAQSMLSSGSLRVYRSDDLVGVELGGSLKNIIAIGAGIIDGLDLGNNAKAAFVTRGLHEITRLGVILGARPETFAGMTGMGDMIATAFSDLSRNRHVGHELALGRELDEILAEMDMTAEGVPTTQAAIALADRHSVEMPITEMTGRVLFEGLDPGRAFEALMRRAPVSETG